MRERADSIDFKTADLCDEFEQSVGVAEPLLRDYGGNTSFYGSLTTVKVFEDNVLVRDAGLTFTPGHYLYADPDGIVIADRDLLT